MVLPEFGIQLAQIEGGIQNVGVGVGIAVDGGSGTVQTVLNVLDAHQGVRGGGGGSHETETGRMRLKRPTM